MIDEKSLALAYRLGSKSLVDFRQIFHPSVGESKAAWFHFKWSDVLLFGNKHFAIEAFRESAKSQYVDREFPLYCLTYPSRERDYIVFLLANQRKASAKLKEVTNEYLSDPLLSSNLIKIHEQSAIALDVTVEDIYGNPVRIRIEAYGKGSSIRGLNYGDRRPKLVILDDVQDEDESFSDVVQEDDYEWFMSDVIFLGQNTRIFMIGNNQGEKCLIERVMKDADRLGFEKMVIPILDEDDNSNWPDKFPVEEVIKERDNWAQIGTIDIWWRNKMCKAISPDSQIFKKETFKYYNQKEAMPKTMSIYILVDLAISESKKADFTVVLVLGVTPDNHWFILDCEYGRINPTEQMDAIFKMVEKWHPIKVGIEQVNYQAALKHFLEKEMPKRDIFFTVFPLKAQGKKTERIATLQPRFTTGTIWFPEGHKCLPELEKELLAFSMDGSRGLHDDIIDALAYAQQIVTVPVRKNSGKNIPKAGRM